jgi:hypothetical protein
VTTHLVIADVPTLDRILRATDQLELREMHDVPLGGWLVWRHTETGERWLFRPPEAEVPDVENVGFIFGLDCGVANSLPLIAACDLLGVDEL